MDCNDSKRLICFLKFVDGRLPDVYVIPATAWQNLNEALTYRKYDKPGQSNKPEWGISCTIKNLPLLEKYRAEKYLEQYRFFGVLWTQLIQTFSKMCFFEVKIWENHYQK